jgi:hypothetical protein
MFEQRSAMLWCLLLCCGVAGSGCGLTVGSARETAAVRSCDFSARCSDVGQGKQYANLDECLTKQRAFWLDAWPTSSCGNALDAAAFDTCLKAIDNTLCDNVFDQLVTYTKCAASNVCK